MAVLLSGGCRVTEMREGTPVTNGSIKIWPQIGRASGPRSISLRILEFAPGLSPGIRNGSNGDILYFLENFNDSEQAPGGSVNIFIDGWSYEVKPQTGIFLHPEQTLTVNNSGQPPRLFASAQYPEPLSATEFVSPMTSPRHGSPRSARAPIVRLSDRKTIPAGDRWYRVLVDQEVGSTEVTQFVGSIPPGRAPDHYHYYEEVLFILRGTGRIWAGETNTSIGPGSCIYLPKRLTHCVENTGHDELRLLGVFYPAGSPSVRYET